MDATTNALLWPSVVLYWMSRKPECFRPMLVKYLLVAYYSRIVSDYVMPRARKKHLAFLLSYVPAAALLLQQVLTSRIYEFVSYRELIVASTYRVIMELAWANDIRLRRLPGALASPLTITDEYKFVPTDTRFFHGLAIDGYASLVLAPLLLSSARLSRSAILSYQVVGATTLALMTATVVSHLKGLHLWTAPQTTDSFTTQPRMMQVHLGSTFGWIVHALTLQKLGYINV